MIYERPPNLDKRAKMQKMRLKHTEDRDEDKELSKKQCQKTKNLKLWIPSVS